MKIPLEIEESISVEERKTEVIVGEYDILNDSVYCVFSFKELNYLFLRDKVIEITDLININFRVNYTDKEVSFFEILNNDISLIKEEYFNNHKPLINPFDGDEDWEYVNFAYHLANYINKAKENPDIPLFPNQNKDIS